MINIIRDKYLLVKEAYRACNGFSKLYWDNYHKIKRLKKRYNGRCFIIGNGPSLSVSDLELIKNEYCFASNRIYKIYDQTTWRPTFYCLTDYKFFKQSDLREEIISASKESDIAFFQLDANKNKHLSHLLNIVMVPLVSQIWRDRASFSTRPENFVYNGYTVTYMAIQLAVYMGFTEIYLIGCDNNYPYRKTMDGLVVKNESATSGHFYEESKSESSSNYYDFVTKSYRNAEIYSQKKNKFKIYNATRGGVLEEFERVLLEDVLHGQGNIENE